MTEGGVRLDPDLESPCLRSVTGTVDLWFCLRIVPITCKKNDVIYYKRISNKRFKYTYVLHPAFIFVTTLTV